MALFGVGRELPWCYGNRFSSTLYISNFLGLFASCILFAFKGSLGTGPGLVASMRAQVTLFLRSRIIIVDLF
jgi:hypothetical protein